MIYFVVLNKVCKFATLTISVKIILSVEGDNDN